MFHIYQSVWPGDSEYWRHSFEHLRPKGKVYNNLKCVKQVFMPSCLENTAHIKTFDLYL